MKVSIICDKFKKAGGMENYLLDVVKGFSQRQIRPTIYACSFDRSLTEYTLIQPQSINVSYIPRKFRLPIISYLFEKKQKIHSDTIFLSTSYISSDVIFCGGQHKGYLKALKKATSLSDRFKIWNEQRSLNQSKLVIAHSKLMKKELQDLYNIEEDKIKVIYPPVDTSKFSIITQEERHRLREKLGFNTTDILYLFPSTGHKRKGYEILKSFFNNTDLPIKLVVAGTPVEESKNVISLGFRNDMPDLYKISDFTIMASTYEPFGLVGIESILSGTPIIFSENMGCLEVLKGNFGFTFNKDDLSSLSDAIKNSISSRTRIYEPLSCLSYNPELPNHIELIINEIQNIN
ncbi:glycosyltransferase family 4 protein [Mannheimia sp. E30BD]|uniref:glycosyltransferase family 4 protein n=1 Tax=Mannheimia sp. E30BD TaxID=3278708 RepID=UPI00359E57C2